MSGLPVECTCGHSAEEHPNRGACTGEIDRFTQRRTDGAPWIDACRCIAYEALYEDDSEEA